MVGDRHVTVAQDGVPKTDKRQEHPYRQIKVEGSGLAHPVPLKMGWRTQQCNVSIQQLVLSMALGWVGRGYFTVKQKFLKIWNNLQFIVVTKYRLKFVFPQFVEKSCKYRIYLWTLLIANCLIAFECQWTFPTCKIIFLHKQNPNCDINTRGNTIPSSESIWVLPNVLITFF